MKRFSEWSVMFDHDHVLCNGNLLHWINEYLGTKYVENDFTSYYMQEIISEEARDDFLKFLLSQKDVYKYTKLNEGAVEVTRELTKAGVEVFIGSSFIIRGIEAQSGILLQSKFNHLITNFPFLDPNKFHFTGDKKKISCDAKVDDLIKNLEYTKHKILVTAYHNKTISDKELFKKKIKRADNCWEVGNIIDKILSKRLFK